MIHNKSNQLKNFQTLSLIFIQKLTLHYPLRTY